MLRQAASLLLVLTMGGAAVNPPTERASNSAVAIQSDGAIVVTGHYVTGDEGTYVGRILTRYDDQGVLDLTFGDEGYAGGARVGEAAL